MSGAGVVPLEGATPPFGHDTGASALRGDWSAFETDCPATLSHPRAPVATPNVNSLAD